MVGRSEIGRRYDFFRVQLIPEPGPSGKFEIAIYRLVEIPEKELDVVVDSDAPLGQRTTAGRLGEQQGSAARLAGVRWNEWLRYSGVGVPTPYTSEFVEHQADSDREVQ